MATASPESKLSRLTGFIRSPFRMSSASPSADQDWYTPYNGPIETPTRIQPAYIPNVSTDPFERGRSSASKRVSKMNRKSRPSFLSLETGGIGESPAAPEDDYDTPRSSITNRIFLGQKNNASHPDPSQNPGVLRHPYNPHGPNSSTFSSNFTQPLSATSDTTPTSDPSSPFFIPRFRYEMPHPYSAGAPPAVSSSDHALSGSTNGQSLPFSGRRRAGTSRSDYAVTSVSSISEPQQVFEHDRSHLHPHIAEGRFEGRDHGSATILKSLSTARSLSRTLDQSSPISPYALQSHPFATSSPSSGKPPVPSKSLIVLQRLRSSTSTPNLLADQNLNYSNRPPPSKLASRPRLSSAVHENPLSLGTQSLVHALVVPRPRFIVAPTPPDVVPQSPFTLARPPFEQYDLDSGFSHCLPSSKLKPPPSNIVFPPQPEPTPREDVLTQAVRENDMLSEERARWAARASHSFGNKRSRSLSNRGMQRAPRRYASTNALSGASSRDLNTETSGVDFSTLSTAKSVSAQGSLKYIAAAAFGHSHSRKISADTSAGTSQSGRSSGAVSGAPASSVSRVGSQTRAHSPTSSGDAKAGHKRKESARAVHKTVVGTSLPGEDNVQQPNEDESAEVVEILPNLPSRQRSGVSRVDQRIGVALSTPPPTPPERQMLNHPYAMASPSIPMKAGPHLASPVIPSAIPIPGDVVNRHRLPPQVHAHQRSLSGQTPFPFTAAADAFSSPTVPAIKVSSHPYTHATEKKRSNRPSSGLVEESFENAMMASTRSSWFQRSASGTIPPWLEVNEKPSNPTPEGPQNIVDDFEPDTNVESLGGPIIDQTRPAIDPTAIAVVSMSSRSVRSFRREGNERRSLSLSELPIVVGPSARPLRPRHFRSASQPSHLSVEPPNPNDGHSLQADRSVDSSLGPSPNPELVVEDYDDLDHFRDLFFRPNYTTHSSQRSSRTAESVLRHSGTPSSYWGFTAPPFVDDDRRPSGDWLHAADDLGEDENTSTAHGHTIEPHAIGDYDDDSVYLKTIDSSLPSIQDGNTHRHSSTPIIDNSEEIDLGVANAIHLGVHFGAQQSPPRSPSSLPQTASPYSATLSAAHLIATSSMSGSDDDARFSHLTTTSASPRMSNIISGFPSPPAEVVPAASSILSSYFFDSPSSDSLPELPRYPSGQFENGS